MATGVHVAVEGGLVVDVGKNVDVDVAVDVTVDKDVDVDTDAVVAMVVEIAVFAVVLFSIANLEPNSEKMPLT